MSTYKLILMITTILGVALTLVESAPAADESGQYNIITMSEIKAEADKQLIRNPAQKQRLTVFSQTGNGFLNVKPGNTGARNLRILQRQRHADNILFRSETLYYDTLVSFITRRGYDGKSAEWDGISDAERLVREGNKLVARMVDEEEASQFMIKRYPPVCEGSDVTNKPQFVQLMLVERDGGDYHRSLLNVVPGNRGQVEIQLMKTSEVDDCKNLQSPSVDPGTLFMLNYN